MIDQPSSLAENRMPAPGVPTIRNVNWGGLKTLYVKEVRRFFKVQLQTIWAPAMSQLLLMVVFTTALGGRGSVPVGGVSVPFAAFIAPGLIVMGMLNNAFANSSFSLLVGKIQGTIVDYLMPPLSTAELLAALVGGAVTRAFCVGFAVWLAMLLFLGGAAIPANPLVAILFGLLGSALLAFLGVLTSIWGEKFDHAAAVTNFVIAPLTLLSGTFYSVDRLAPAFQAVSHANPFFYIISGFRYGFLGVSDGFLSVWAGAGIVLALDIVLGTLCYVLLRSGWKLKN
ncbi:ABC transporter permease [uncultured Sphingomonas sp.]|uniref:ABC transporter permease n=1 Tax=uncultured Sphingomonas sp. TaxID=158754 RepID=UPI0025D7A26D|nr:ABC transporter permease [uncultured Sphingomonas sp.]